MKLKSTFVLSFKHLWKSLVKYVILVYKISWIVVEVILTCLLDPTYLYLSLKVFISLFTSVITSFIPIISLFILSSRLLKSEELDETIN